jgi:SAM-dependent methyltransferase
MIGSIVTGKIFLHMGERGPSGGLPPFHTIASELKPRPDARSIWDSERFLRAFEKHMEETGHYKVMHELYEDYLTFLSWRFGYPFTTLDSCCGTGEFVKYLASYHHLSGGNPFGKITANDASAVALKLAREKIAALGKSEVVEFTQSDVHALPFPDASFKFVIVSYGMHWFGNLEEQVHAAAEFNRVLIEGGQVVVFHEWPLIISQSSGEFGKLAAGILEQVTLLSPEQLDHVFEQASFSRYYRSEAPIDEKHNMLMSVYEKKIK